MNRLLKPALLAAFVWNIFLVVGVIADQSYAFKRAAGGQFDNFPAGIRIAYLLNLVVVIYQALILLTKIKRAQWMARVLFVLGTLSVLINALSRSSLERWNALPASIIAFAFYKELRSQKNN